MLDRLTIERLDARTQGGRILVAFSGGSDSAALLLLLADRFGADRLRVAIVDHAIRAGSAEDAKRAAAFADDLGIHADILTVDWGRGSNRSQQAAREARYRLLCNAAGKHGAHAIALGHTADDQAETMLMRAAAGSTWRGLAGVAPFTPAPVWPEGRGLMLARPLLGARREQLRTFLRERGATWIDDPANENAAYERVRIRRRLAALERAGFNMAPLLRVAQRLRAIAEGVDAGAAALLERAARCQAGTITIDLRSWSGDVATRQRGLSVLLAAASGAQREPAPDAVERLEDKMRAPDFRGATLGGAALAVRRGDVVLTRDSGALSGRADGAQAAQSMPLPAGEEVVWDGRLALTASAPDAMVHAYGATPRIEAPDNCAVATQWLLSVHIAHLLAAVAHDPNSKTPQNEINISKP